MLQVDGLQHAHRHVPGSGEGGRLPPAQRLDGVEAGGRQLHVLEGAALGQQHRRRVGAGIEVEAARVGPGRLAPARHGHDLLRLVLPEHADLGLGREGGITGEQHAHAVVAPAGHRDRVDDLAHLGVRLHPTRFALAPHHHTLALHEAVGAVAQAVLPGQGGEDPRGGLRRRQTFVEVEGSQHHVRPLRVRDRRGPRVAVERQEGERRDARGGRQQARPSHACPKPQLH